MPHSTPGWGVAGRFHQEPADSLRRPVLFGFSPASIAVRLLPALAVAAVLLASLLAPARGLPNYSLVAGCGYGYGSPPVVTGVSPRLWPHTRGTTPPIPRSGALQ